MDDPEDGFANAVGRLKRALKKEHDERKKSA
eukprot:SAG22_NODE_231_length_14551_cov_22.298090_11_plen_31_part_00